MKQVFIAIGVVSLVAAAGCDETRKGGQPPEHQDRKTIRAAEVRGEGAHTIQMLNEAVHRSGPFCSRMQQIEEHARWLFEEGPLSTHVRYRDAWFECKRVVPELIEPAKAIVRSLREQIADLAPDGTLTKEEASKLRKIIYQGKELAGEIAHAVHARNTALEVRIEPALRRYPLPPARERGWFPGSEK